LGPDVAGLPCFSRDTAEPLESPPSRFSCHTLDAFRAREPIVASRPREAILKNNGFLKLPPYTLAGFDLTTHNSANTPLYKAKKSLKEVFVVLSPISLWI
jgi:hypothetical protein